MSEALHIVGLVIICGAIAALIIIHYTEEKK